MQFETYYRELENDAAIIHAMVEGISPEEARHRPDPTSWSVLEVLCHLLDEEREDFRQRLDIVLHRPQEPWPPIDPEGWVTTRHYNERDLAETLAHWLAERQRSLAWLQSLSSPDWETTYMAYFGPIHAGDLLAAWAAHDNLHLRQLVELQRARLERLAPPYNLPYAGPW